MFKILGSDGKEYGPVSADVVQQWIQQRRANGQTRVQLEGTAEWKPLAEIPEFASAFAAKESSAPPPLPPIHPASPTGALQANVPKTSGLAIASLVLGILGFCGVTAIIGFVLGIVAQVKIRRSGGRLKGKGLAIAGICISAVMFLFSLAIAAGLIIPALAKAKHRGSSGNCENNIKQIGLAIRLYADENDGKCPQAVNWCDAIQGNVNEPEAFQCPQRREEKSGFGFNSKLAGRILSGIPPDTVILFETSGGWNFSGGAKDIVQRPPHGRKYTFAFVDGSVRQLSEDEMTDLRWEP